MYKFADIFNKNLTKKPITPLPINVLHQHQDQIVEQRKAKERQKQKQEQEKIALITNKNLRNKEISAMAKNFLKNNKPIKCVL